MSPQETFVTRMRRFRERSRISLDQIAAETCIKRDLLDAFERNDLSGWPTGVYARAWVRAYATAIGFDPNETVDEFCRLFPQGDRRGGRTMVEMAAIVAASSEYRDEFQQMVAEDRRRPAGVEQPAPKPGFRDHLARAARAMRGLLLQKPFLHRTEYRERQ